eukprot:3752426-Pleurochrysis_carterae.AAC.2
MGASGPLRLTSLQDELLPYHTIPCPTTVYSRIRCCSDPSISIFMILARSLTRGGSGLPRRAPLTKRMG